MLCVKSENPRALRRGSRNEHGYGRLNRSPGLSAKASRASYELGDAAANAQDMARKGRAPAHNGQSLLTARITDAQVFELRTRAAAGESYEALGEAARDELRPAVRSAPGSNANLATTAVYLASLSNSEVIEAVSSRPRPMVPAL